MQPRSERQKILWAVFLSLLLHLVVGVSIASFGDKLQPSLPEDEKPVELTIVDVAPMPTPPGDLLAIIRASPPPTARTPGPEKEIRSPSPKAASTPVTHPPASSAYRREQIQERMAGNISKRGVASVNAVGTPLGRYEKKVYDAIGKRWYALCDANRDRVDIGTVHVQFVVAPNGKINDIKVTSGGTSASFTNLCLQSIQEAKPEAIPEDVMAVLPPDGLPGEISFTGFQNP